jgi:acetylornithine deacetylase/succinyl-diaminopimelate desuccinylase-like protein
MDSQKDKLQASVSSYWEEFILPTLMRYIEIPAKSPAFDPEWEKNGYIDQVVELAVEWVKSRKVPGLDIEVLKAANKTPLIVLHRKKDVSRSDDTQILLYGHLDKQPEMTGWAPDLGPWKAVRKGSKLYGRGGADDGYALFACVCALEQCIQKNIALPDLRILIELSEESGSVDLPYYVENHKDALGNPDLVICLDSGAANYEQLWMTTSLRGLVNGTLRVDVTREGVHSGDASGIVPSSFRIAREILSRLEDSKSGKILEDSFRCAIPKERILQADKVSETIGAQVFTKYPFLEGTTPIDKNYSELLLNRTWRPALEVIGADGLPPSKSAGNVMRPFTALKLSLRLPPLVDAKEASLRLKTLLEANPPYGAKVCYTIEDAATGWNAPETSPKLASLLEQSSNTYFGKNALALGEGGSIPFMGMLGKAFPNAQFVITGVLGPESNAHGPNEFLEVEYAKKLNCCVIDILSAYSA